MAARVNTSFVDAGLARVRGSGTNVFRAGGETTRDGAFQAQVAPERAWVKTLTVETSLAAPQITTLQTELDAAEASISTLQTAASGLNARVFTLETNAIAGQPAGSAAGRSALRPGGLQNPSARRGAWRGDRDGEQWPAPT